MIMAVAVLLVISPRHRAFYLGSGRPDRARTEEAPRTSVVTTALRPITAVLQLPGPDPAGRIRIPLSDPMPSRLPVEGVPPGWQLKEFQGHGVVELVRDEGQPALRLRSDHASFALYRDAVIDLDRTPRLAWSWKVKRLPREGDVRGRATDDQAAQVYVIFPRWPAPLRHSDVIGYVWDSHAPVATRVTSPKSENVRVIVVESGAQSTGTWRREVRDVAEDYAAAFGRRAPRVGKIALMIDSNDTGDEAEALFGELAFLPPR